MKRRSEVKENAKVVMKGKVFEIFGIIFLVELFLTLIEYIPNIFGVQTEVTQTTEFLGQMVETTSTTPFGSVWSLATALIGGLAAFALAYYILNLVRGKKVTVSEVFEAIKKQWLTIILVEIIVAIFIILGVICFIIPGIIVALGLSLTVYVMVDNPEMEAMNVIKTTWNLMKGHKGEYFVYGLSFIGWILLCCLIIPLIYVLPYIAVTFALFYEEVKNNQKAQ